MIRTLAVQENKAVLISSHILTELAEICDTVAIIERGSLLATGTVDEIQRGASKQRGVRVTPLAKLDELAAWLRARDGVFDVTVAAPHVVFHHRGDNAAEAKILRAMVQADFEIASFGGKDETLEDVFMNVTKGRLQ